MRSRNESQEAHALNPRMAHPDFARSVKLCDPALAEGVGSTRLFGFFFHGLSDNFVAKWRMKSSVYSRT